ncbi:hypothetical protein CEXT_35561 [Caerostris extrusa]|uniref:Uncharacterized protein n=1 Tax=Caerostris extrusa TaxID=172846 RepID=A0AAV4UHY4_CAEEX|nr:hypothetical protein CEXT_35561 [Caerostris extrusa]
MPLATEGSEPTTLVERGQPQPQAARTPERDHLDYLKPKQIRFFGVFESVPSARAETKLLTLKPKFSGQKEKASFTAFLFRGSQ